MPSPVKHAGHVPKTPARKGALNTTWVQNQPDDNAEGVHDEKRNQAPGIDDTFGRVEALLLSPNPSLLSTTGSPQLVLMSAREEPDMIPESESAAGTAATAATARSPPNFNYRHRLSERLSVKTEGCGEKGVESAGSTLSARFAHAGYRDDTAADKEATSEQSNMATVVRDRLMHRIKALAEKGAISPSQRGYLNELISAPPTQVVVPSPPDAISGSDVAGNQVESNMGGRTRHHPHRTLTPTNLDASQLLGVPAPPAAGVSM